MPAKKNRPHQRRHKRRGTSAPTTATKRVREPKNSLTTGKSQPASLIDLLKIVLSLANLIAHFFNKP